MSHFRCPKTYISTFALVLLASLGITAARAEDTIRVGYLNQIHDAAVMAMEKELSSKYKIKMIRFLRYNDTELGLNSW